MHRLFVEMPYYSKYNEISHSFQNCHQMLGNKTTVAHTKTLQKLTWFNSDDKE